MLVRIPRCNRSMQQDQLLSETDLAAASGIDIVTGVLDACAKTAVASSSV
jgi:hypothetical protein